MGDVVYRSDVRIERVRGPVRRAYLPATEEPTMFGVHGAIADHYGVQPESGIRDDPGPRHRRRRRLTDRDRSEARWRRAGSRRLAVGSPPR